MKGFDDHKTSTKHFMSFGILIPFLFIIASVSYVGVNNIDSGLAEQAFIGDRRRYTELQATESLAW